MQAFVIMVSLLTMLAADSLQAAEKDVAALEGAWTMASLEVEGQKVEEARIQGSELTIKDGKYIVTTRGQNHETKFTLDPTQTPKHIDMTPQDGPNKDKTLAGIYKLDGDTFTVCRSINPDFNRPKEFVTSPGTGLFLVVWKRKAQ